MEPAREEWPVQPRDFYDHLLNQERKLDTPADPRERRLCVAWIIRACSDYGFSPETGGLAVIYFDAFMMSARSRKDSKGLTFKQLMVLVGSEAIDTGKHKESQICELICIVSIAIAAKKVEPKEKAPFLGDFDENFSFQELKAMESHVLGLLSWDLRGSTVYEFVHYWLGRTTEVHRKKIRELANESIAYCIKENDFAERTPSGFGAATILWAHAAAGLPTQHLEADIVSHLGVSLEDELQTACENMGTHMLGKYPDAYRPCGAGRHSPSSIMDVVANTFSSEAFSADRSMKAGLKRPTPERPDRVFEPMVPKNKKCKAAPELIDTALVGK